MTKINIFKIATIVIILIFFGCKKKEPLDYQIEKEISQDMETEEATPVVIDTVVVIETQLQRGEGPFNVMERLNIDRRLRQKIIDSLANETDFTTLKVGERFAGIFDLDTAKLLEFIYFQDVITTHRIKFSYSQDEAEIAPEVSYVLDEKPSEIRYRLIKGTLNSSTLDSELRGMDLPSNIVGVATNILECKIPFRTDARIGDEFELLLRETIYKDSTENGEIEDKILNEKTQILLVSYSGTRAGNHRGFRYFDGDKSSYNAHYTEDGEALIFSGLRYPLDKIHITSNFGMRRHPVTGQNTTHWGVDYRASAGTPVYAVADGKVVKSTYDDLSGNYIAIKHNDNTTSYYLHLNKRSVNVGANVRARQVIGLSGNTGRSNGPHLHFGFKQTNGQWMNPLQKRMIATPKLSGEKLDNLKVQIAEIKRVYEEQE
ncbi:MAG: peptidoglycan DD-metalloendopeptidase family protein [Chitinivibrionia bacterium]|nr:peptidoglycan DD-metalloendopeptidase family protein [Chitinivibrionia bacterium]